jgi:hypothetical protein
MNKNTVKEERVKKKILILVVTIATITFLLVWCFPVHESFHLLVCKIATGDGTITWSMPPSTSCTDFIRMPQPVYFLYVAIPYMADTVLVSAIFFISRKHPIAAFFAYPPVFNTFINYSFTLTNQDSDFMKLFILGLEWKVISVILFIATMIIGVLTLFRLREVIKHK